MNSKNNLRIRRFTTVQRIFHLLLMVTFIIQAATGLGRMYMESSWGKSLLAVFGGYEFSRTIHIRVGWIMLWGFGLHALYLLFKINWRAFPASLFGPDSLLPRWTDFKHGFEHLAWMFGGRRHPDFDRWGYWEKFDYWAVFWGMAIIGGTGLILARPLESTRLMPGWALNVAFWIHRIEAILAIGHVFIIHFFISHLRRTHFPMDRAIFEGSADLEAVRRERPAWIQRLESSGALKGILVGEAGVGLRTVYYLTGYLAMAAGLFLLIGAAANVFRITW